MSGGTYRAPDGRSFRTYIGSCAHLPPCWCARCECGHKLTAHDFDEEGAVACALDAMRCDDPRPSFGHKRCVASRHAQAELPLA